ncbi:hypothetical protein [Actinomadura oligospora]|uniref:hypothetical protein n=1 Tax=Actinomadura oligospora TaxID=111804 RepID=UPI00047DB65C|nr:hypothetical protein [Actinomadura oligospora]
MSNEDADDLAWERSAVVRVTPSAKARKLAKVPFVEMAGGRLQGVVSSGSDIARVYVSSIAAETHAFSCSTNNNRRCGGLGGSYMCKHLDALLKEAVLQYGAERVAAYLGVEAGPGGDVAGALDGTESADNPAATVFNRFLRHLAYLELPARPAPVPEMQWFPAGAVG